MHQVVPCGTCSAFAWKPCPQAVHARDAAWKPCSQAVHAHDAHGSPVPKRYMLGVRMEALFPSGTCARCEGTNRRQPVCVLFQTNSAEHRL